MSVCLRASISPLPPLPALVHLPISPITLNGLKKNPLLLAGADERKGLKNLLLPPPRS
ncbi:hypothetical protein INR49_011754 [Caranx melampygus]|nr:hypothetical protein INR49_011754 [Caranx melampygus]